MKKLSLEFEGIKEMLTKKEMKQIGGGYIDGPSCDWTWAVTPGCAGEFGYDDSELACPDGQTLAQCQKGADNNCDTNECCVDVDCT